jgi:hypothetical protein
MIARILATSAVLALSIVSFLGDGPAPAGVNSPGVVLLIGAAFVWFAWPAGYSYRSESRQESRKRPDIITIGAAPLLKDSMADDERRGSPS